MTPPLPDGYDCDTANAEVLLTRMGMDFGMFNGPGYETSGGPWITAERSMQEICFSTHTVAGGQRVSLSLERPRVNPRSNTNPRWLFYNPEKGKFEIPDIPERKTYYRDIAVLAAPAKGIVPRERITDLSDKLGADGRLQWDAPAGDWIVYRFGHTTMGNRLQPTQWEAKGFECDKMNPEAVAFHMNHVIGEIKKHLAGLIGTGFTFVHLDSYEAGKPTWTPRMREEFAARRGYEMTPFLATFAKRTIGSAQETAKFKTDFEDTIKDLYRDVHFALTSKMLKEAGLVFSSEPYGGPWRSDEIMPHIHRVMVEFWTRKGIFFSLKLDETVAALRKSGQNIVEAESFTGSPADSQWNETPAWLKPIGDTAFCKGVNRFILARYVPQSWDDRYQPGNAMGQWGTHFDRTQTWWKPGKAMVQYWTRCNALLQWGRIVMETEDFAVAEKSGEATINAIHRRQGETDVYFVANTARSAGAAKCRFNVTGRQPELWDPVTGAMRSLPRFEEANGATVIPLEFAPAQSFFVVFRQPVAVRSLGANFPVRRPVAEVAGPWEVRFDPRWGAPEKIMFKSLEDWTRRPEPGIKYYSGTAVYHKAFDMTPIPSQTFLDLGTVNHLARIRLNGRDLGVVWTAPWDVSVPAGLLKQSGNQLEIEVTNTWANRLIGDEQEPPDCEWLPGHMGGWFLKEFPDWFVKNQPRPSKGRYCFTVWNYFTKDSPLQPSGLLGPVKMMAVR